MPMRCSVCRHPEREAIDAALVAGEPFRNIAQRHGLDHTAIFRHNQEHLPEAMVRAQAAQATAHGDNLLAQLEALSTDARRIRDKAESAGDLKTALAGIRELTRLMELTAKLRGELAQEGTVNVLVAPEWVRVRTVLLDALTPYPDARTAVAGQLLALEAGR